MSLPALSLSDHPQPSLEPPSISPIPELGDAAFRTLFNFSSDAILLLDPRTNDWPIVDCNDAACRMNGYTRAELLGQSIDILDPVPTALVDRSTLPERLRTGKYLKFETVHRHKNGTIFPIEVSTTLINLSGRELILGIDREITERKQVEETLRQQNDYFEALHDTTVALLSGLEITDLLAAILNRAIALFGTSNGYIYLLSATGDTMEIRVDSGLDGPANRERRRGEGLVGKVWEAGQPIIVNNYDEWPGRAAGIPPGQFGAMLAAPLTYAGKIQGVLGLAYAASTKVVLGEAETELLTRFAQLASLALENARALETERLARQEAVMLQAATQALSTSLDLETVLNLILTKLKEVVPYNSASVQEIRQGKLEIIGGDGFPNWDQIRGLKFSPTDKEHPNHEVLATRQPFILNDVTASRYTVFQGRLHLKIGIRSWLGVPLLFGNDAIGMITLDKREPNFFTEAHGQVALAFATQAAIAIKNARMYTAAQEYAAENEALYHAASHLLNPGNDLDSLAYQITHAVVEEFELANCNVLLMDESGTHLRKAATAGDVDMANLDILPLDGPGLMTASARLGVMIYAPDVVDDPRYVIGDSRTRSELVMPLIFQEKVIGVLDLQSPNFNAFGESAQRIITAFAKQAALALENIRLVTNLGQAYQQLKTDQDQLLAAEKMASLGRLTAGIAHEMNTPLAAVRAGLSELNSLAEEYQAALSDPDINLDDHQAIAADMQKVLQFSGSAAERAAAFVRSIKSQTRESSPAERSVFNAVPVIKDTLLLLAHVLRQSQCTVTFEPQEVLYELIGAPDRLAQVVTNLVTNAVDACAEKGTGQVNLHLHPVADGLNLEVTDTGAGIPPEVLSRIFEPMFTTKPFGKGTGLGLTIIRDIVTGDFGGTVEVQSTVGEGTTFTLHFPSVKGALNGA